MSECDHNCSSCGQDCSSREGPVDMREKPHILSSVKKVIGVVSGKGGVGKSLVTSAMAVALQRRGKKCGIMDADITGPSIPKSFGITEKAMGDSQGIYPRRTDSGIDVISINLLLEDDSDPVILRGPLIAGIVKQFWTDVIWDDVDYLFVDMPPGTGDVPLTVFQSLPVDGILIVTSPQELVSMIVEKAVRMAQKMEIPVIGLIENMSYAVCPDCKKHIEIFGKSHIEKIAAEYHTPVLARIPIDPEIVRLVDAGKAESIKGEWMDIAAQAIIDMC